MSTGPDSAVCLLLAALDSSGWTDKEMLTAIGSTVAIVVPACLFIMRLAVANARRAAKKANQAAKQANQEKNSQEKMVREMEKKIEQLLQPSAGEVPQIKDLQEGMHELRRQLDRFLKEKEANQADAANARMLAEELARNLDSLQVKLQQYENELAVEQRRIKRALSKDGHTWMEKVLRDAPDFKPLAPDSRRMPIISVLNLKGGVGKTTTTANLGAALDSLGYRVLLLDLDLQGSLTGLFLPTNAQVEMFNSEKMMGDFLTSSFGAEYPNLLDYTAPILPDGKSGLVPTTDGLAYAETNLTIRWVLREGSKDPRFLLRRELHLVRIRNKYDIVLLDCPPLINVCCVNALAASDYVLIPILPSKQATDRVPVLLRRLRQFQENINNNLAVLGILANRTHRSELTVDEANRLSSLRVTCKDLWGHEVPQLETFIRQSAEVRVAEDEHRPLGPSDEMHSAFVELAREVESRMPTFCQPAGKAAKAAKEVVS
ncbi:MAG: AAA family ATPase [Gemmataceae bacterium]